MAGALRSWTMWFNGLLALLWVLAESSDLWLPAVAQVLPPEYGKWLSLVAVLGNLALRLRTSQPLAAKGVSDAGA